MGENLRTFVRIQGYWGVSLRLLAQLLLFGDQNRVEEGEM